MHDGKDRQAKTQHHGTLPDPGWLSEVATAPGDGTGRRRSKIRGSTHVFCRSVTRFTTLPMGSVSRRCQAATIADGAVETVALVKRASRNKGDLLLIALIQRPEFAA